MKMKIPSYRKQKKSKGQDVAFVELNGQKFYLGKHGSPESKIRYEALIAEWLASNKYLPTKEDQQGIVNIELIARFLKHADGYYRKPNGQRTPEYEKLKSVLAVLKSLYPHLPVNEFSPLKLKAVRQKMIEKKWARLTINQAIGKIKLVYKWGVENELVKPDVLHGLQAVSGIKAGRNSQVTESKPVKPVPKAHIEAVRPYVSRQIWALIQCQLLTACRPSELLQLKPIDIEMGSKVWLYTPEDHKTAYRGIKRTIYFGPKAQQVINEFMPRPVHMPLFSPKDATQEKAQQAQTHRRAKQKQNPRKTERKVNDYYSISAYRRSISRACVKANIPSWSPNRLRHNAATFIRKEYGLEVAQIMLGHSKADVTQIYAEVNHEKALKIVEKIG
ncbi:MAG: site-specific integrase [Phycisphaerae bacterium]|nr:site-specific integrase [Phycisphaerae bacterium]